MSHAFADELFCALANHALDGDVASTLSLHGGRILLAVALRARGYGADMIKAICRWNTDASAVLYARLLHDEHTAAVDLAMDAKIIPTLIATTRRDCVLDNDHCVQRVGGAHDALGRATARAASPSGPPTHTAADSRTTPAPAPARTTTPAARPTASSSPARQSMPTRLGRATLSPSASTRAAAR